MGYSTPLYMTFMQAKEAGASIMKGEKSFPVIYWNFSVKDKNGNKINIEDYRKLSEEEKKEYKVTPYMKTYNVFNVSQTNYPEVQPKNGKAEVNSSLHRLLRMNKVCTPCRCSMRLSEKDDGYVRYIREKATVHITGVVKDAI